MALVRTVTPDGEEIYQRRVDQVLTAAALARKIGRHPQTIRAIESGRLKSVSEILIRQIARALDTTQDEITKRAA